MDPFAGTVDRGSKPLPTRPIPLPMAGLRADLAPLPAHTTGDATTPRRATHPACIPPRGRPQQPETPPTRAARRSRGLATWPQRRRVEALCANESSANLVQAFVSSLTNDLLFVGPAGCTNGSPRSQVLTFHATLFWASARSYVHTLQIYCALRYMSDG